MRATEGTSPGDLSQGIPPHPGPPSEDARGTVRLISALFGLLATLGASPALAGGGFPYTTDTGREIGLMGGSVGVLLTGLQIRNDVPFTQPSQWESLDRASLPSLDQGATRFWSPRAARASDLLVSGLDLAPWTLLLTDRGRKQPGKLALINLEVFAVNNASTFFLKCLFGRTRPFVYNPRVPGEHKLSRHAQRSFPSGHTSSAFASAVSLGVMFDRLHPDSDLSTFVWGASLGAATVTGYLRYAAGKHFPTDIFAGAAIGALVGWGIPELHETNGAKENSGDGSPLFTFSISF